MILEETLTLALQKTLYLHRVQILRSAEDTIERNVRTMFASQAYDVLLAIFEADLSEAAREDEKDRKTALVLAAIAAALARRLGRDVATLRPGLLSALTAAVIHSGLSKYGIKGDLRSIRAEQWLLEHGAELVKGINEVTRERMARLLTEGFARKESVDSIATRLTSSFDDMTIARARKIAITEASKAWSYVEMESAEVMERAGFSMVKEWHLGPMHPRYDPCDHNHEAGAIPLHAVFPAGDMAPPQHPSCGCSMITYPDGSAQQPWGSQVLGQTPMMPFGFDQGDNRG